MNPKTAKFALHAIAWVVGALLTSAIVKGESEAHERIKSYYEPETKED